MRQQRKSLKYCHEISKVSYYRSRDTTIYQIYHNYPVLSCKRTSSKKFSTSLISECFRQVFFVFLLTLLRFCFAFSITRTLLHRISNLKYLILNSEGPIISFHCHVMFQSNNASNVRNATNVTQLP